MKHAEKLVGKTIKLFEFSNDIIKFVKNLVPEASEVKIRNGDEGTVVEIHVEKKNRAVVIGRDGKNLKLFKELLQRNHKVNELHVK